MSTRDNSLVESFKDCAPFCTVAPISPLIDRAQLLEQEMVAQLINATLELLSRNYGFAHELSKCKITMGYGFDQTPEGEPVQTIFAACNEDKSISPKKITDWRRRAETFENNFIKCASHIEGVYVAESDELDLVALVFEDPRILWKALWVMTDNLHPENKAAMSHLRTIVHLNDRLLLDECKMRLI